MPPRDIEIPIDGEAPPAGWPAPLDLRALAQQEPHPPAFIIEDWLPAGYATLFAGHGGAGKSSVALHLSCCIALGRAWWGIPTGQRRVLYLSCEDRADVLHWRLRRICGALGVSLPDLGEHLHLLDLVGRPSVLWDALGPTPEYGLLRERMTGRDVLVVDGIADVFAGNENARGEVKRFVNGIVGLIPPNAGAALLVAHVNKATAAGAVINEGYSGSTGWHNAVRARWYLRPEQRSDGDEERTGDLVLELQKSNLGRADQSVRFTWSDSAHLYTGSLVGGRSKVEQTLRDEQERAGILSALRACLLAGEYCPAATTGRRTAHHVLSVYSGFPETLRGRQNTRRFWRHAEALRAMGTIIEGNIRRADRHFIATLELAEPIEQGSAGNAGNEKYNNTRTMHASRSAGNAGNAAGGIRGRAHAHDDLDEVPL